MYTLVIDDAIVAAADLFAPLGKTIIVSGQEIAQHAAQADALFIRSRTQITAELLTTYPNIRFIGSSVVGLDHVDLTTCQDKGVHFYSAQGCNARSVAEYVISQVVNYAVQRQTTPEQLTLAIIGVGHVGTQVAQLAQILGIRLLLNDPYRRDAESDFAHCELDDCLAQADMVTLHTPLEKHGRYPSYQLLAQQHINLLKANALFINAARGDIVDEQALLSRTDLTLITDCWHKEPHINQQLLAHSQLATPHIAGHAWDAKYRGGYLVAQAFAQWSGQNLPTYAPLASQQKPLQTTEKTALAQLNDLLKQAYDFQQDDKKLRNCTDAELAKQFEYYRRHYPMRREWTELTVNNQNLSEITQKWLTQFGFQISVN